ncbi:hypothetical protein FHG87_015044 [Trinorchestia longiramus]|nr:hypothetical protein FHG87_015044 [Trinorchestia longiramus]
MRKDPGSNPAADMVDAARNTAWDLEFSPVKMSAKLAVCVALILCATAALVVAGGLGYNPSYYPGLVSGFANNFYSYQPAAGFKNCRYWCRSQFTRQYYCCNNLNGGGFGGGFNNFGGRFNGGYGGGGKIW